MKKQTVVKQNKPVRNTEIEKIEYEELLLRNNAVIDEMDEETKLITVLWVINSSVQFNSFVLSLSYHSGIERYH